MSNAHTPGPWWVEDRRPGGVLQIQAKHRGEGSSYCVASVNLWEEPEANAHLIAAAPDLLQALRDVELFMRGLVEVGAIPPDHAAWRASVNAIVKAVS